MSDPASGNLLFYTQGTLLWHAGPGVMPNGAGLMGHTSSTQAAISVPLPGSNTIHYLFTSDCLEDGGTDGYRYHIIDMSLNGGLGDIVPGSKNILLYAPSSEQLSAVKHANCIDWWIMTKELNNNGYRAYLVTSSGISAPVISNVGLPTGVSSFGQAKFSPDGTKYAITTGTITQLFDFDNATGMLSNPVTLTGGGFGPGYGLSFSGDNTKLYTCRGSAANQIFQFDLSSGVPATIIASATNVGNSGGYNQFQLGKNHKIYVSHDGFNNFSVINNPNALGTACNFVLGAVAIPSSSTKGVPNFPDSYFNETSPCLLGFVADATETQPNCYGNNTGMAWVNVLNNQGPYTVTWSPGGETTDTIYNLAPGTYTVNATDSAGNTYTDSVIIAYPAPLVTSVNANKDSLCAGDHIIFNTITTGGTPTYDFYWPISPGFNSAVVPYSSLTSSGYVSVTVTDDNGCTTSDSIYITVMPLVDISVSADTCVCSGEQAFLQASGTSGYNWSTGDTTANINVSPLSDSWYTVSWSNGTCADSDSVFVCVYALPVISLSGEDSLCAGLPITINSTVTSGTAPFDYQWSTSPADVLPSITFTPLANTTVQLQVTDDHGCTDEENFTVQVFPVSGINAPPDTCICTGDSVQLTATGAPFYQWNTGENTASIIVTPVTDTLLTVTCTIGPCSTSDSVFICLRPLPTVMASGDTSIEYGYPVELAVVGDPPFNWSPTESLSCSTCSYPVAEPENTTVYTVTATNVYGCTAYDQVTVDIFYIVRIPNIITPNGDGLNDVFKIKGLPPNSTLHIFNRWGNQVYVTENYLNNWQADTDGVYYYALETPDGKTFSGFVQVSGN